jgi:hypothetical protein
MRLIPGMHCHVMMDRHDGVTKLAWAVGAKVVEEPRKKDRRDRKENKLRPDSVVTLPGRKWWTDETICHPYGPTNVSVSAQNPQALLKTAEREKHTKYDEEAGHAAAIFVPIALESTGGFGSEALLFIKERIAESKRARSSTWCGATRSTSTWSTATSPSQSQEATPASSSPTWPRRSWSFYGVAGVLSGVHVHSLPV